MQIKQILLLGSVLLILCAGAHALSPEEAIGIVSTQNNYILSGETASVAKEMITYKGAKYIMIAAQSSGKTNAYIPVKDSTGEIANQDIEVRELIKTAIVYTSMKEYNQQVLAANWPFSYSTKNFYYDLANDYTTLANSLLTVQTELNKMGSAQSALATEAGNTKILAEQMSTACTKLATDNEKARVFEQDFFNNPDTNKIYNYEQYFKNFFTDNTELKDSYNEIEKKINSLNQGVASIEDNSVTIDQKRSLQALLTSPTNARRLPSFFSQNDQMRTQIESVFNSAKNSENYATTLASRKSRNEAWKYMYGPNAELNKLNKNFQTLEDAAKAILSEENKDLWENQDAVNALAGNWSAAKARFTNLEYDKALDYAIKAAGNAKQVLNGGIKQTTDNSNDLIVKVIIGLVAVIIVVFIVEQILSRKKKMEEEGEENDEKY